MRRRGRFRIPAEPSRSQEREGSEQARGAHEGTALVEYLRTNGRDKVLFGTNYPMITPAKCLEHLDRLELDDETRRRFLGGNAARVFGLA